jgi:hypothetical protein
MAHFPQTVLVKGGEVLEYMGPMTAKALFLFVTNNMYSPVYQVSPPSLHTIHVWQPARPTTHPAWPGGLRVGGEGGAGTGLGDGLGKRRGTREREGRGWKRRAPRQKSPAGCSGRRG